MGAAATEDANARRDELVGRLFEATTAAFDLYGVYLGDRLGLYRALADAGPLTSDELGRAAGVHERYAREWLEQQAASGILEVAEETGDHATRRFRLPAGHDEALLDEESLNYVAPFARLFVAAGLPLPELMSAFRTGAGVAYERYGADLYEGQAAFTKPLFVNLLGQEWLPSIPDLHARLQADPPARVADVACGGGISSIAIARAYPKVRVDGIDMDEPSLELARRHLAGSGVEERVEFHVSDAAAAGLRAQYDLVTIFEALHDMSYPVDVLRAARGLLAEGGSVVVCDERTADAFEAPADTLERFLYGVSVMHCLPVGMVGESPAGTGTVMRADTVRRYADEAGFTRFEVLPIENDFFRFYRLRP
jgi:2-polyprenyl-3-methyl-5-hydroxy-6-metoxy-1,4-benzoquinol methylase